jgi:hypothetical protein
MKVKTNSSERGQEISGHFMKTRADGPNYDDCDAEQASRVQEADIPRPSTRSQAENRYFDNLMNEREESLPESIRNIRERIRIIEEEHRIIRENLRISKEILESVREDQRITRESLQIVRPNRSTAVPQSCCPMA